MKLTFASGLPNAKLSVIFINQQSQLIAMAAPKNLDRINFCPDCGSENIVRNEREQLVICKDCGLIYEPFVVIARERPARETLKGGKKKRN